METIHLDFLRNCILSPELIFGGFIRKETMKVIIEFVKTQSLTLGSVKNDCILYHNYELLVLATAGNRHIICYRLVQWVSRMAIIFGNLVCICTSIDCVQSLLDNTGI